MEMLDSVRVGDRLDIKLGENQYRTKTVTLESATTFVVVYLGNDPIPEKYGAGAEVFVTNYHSSGKDDFGGKIIYRGFRDGGLPAMRIEATTSVTRTQRRDYYRLPIEIPVEFLVLSRETITTDIVWRGACSIDVGEGGMLIRSKEGYSVGYELQCRFELGGVQLTINSSVRRSDFDVTPGGDLEFIMGLQFTSGSDESKKHIARFVMQHQTRRPGYRMK